MCPCHAQSQAVGSVSYPRIPQILLRQKSILEERRLLSHLINFVPPCHLSCPFPSSHASKSTHRQDGHADLRRTSWIMHTAAMPCHALHFQPCFVFGYECRDNNCDCLVVRKVRNVPARLAEPVIIPHIYPRHMSRRGLRRPGGHPVPSRTLFTILYHHFLSRLSVTVQPCTSSSEPHRHASRLRQRPCV